MTCRIYREMRKLTREGPVRAAYRSLVSGLVMLKHLRAAYRYKRGALRVHG